MAYAYVNASHSPLDFVPVVGIVAGGTNQQIYSLNITFNTRGIAKEYADTNINIVGCTFRFASHDLEPAFLEFFRITLPAKLAR